MHSTRACCPPATRLIRHLESVTCLQVHRGSGVVFGLGRAGEEGRRCGEAVYFVSNLISGCHPALAPGRKFQVLATRRPLARIALEGCLPPCAGGADLAG